MKMYALLKVDGEKLCVKVKAKTAQEAAKLLEINYNFDEIIKIANSKDDLNINLNPTRKTGYIDRPTYRGSRSSKRFFI